MLYRALLRFFAKREGKIHSNFDKQKVFNLASCIVNCIRRRFLITQFVATEALGKNNLADMRQSIGSFHLFVHQLSLICQCCILSLNLTNYLCSEFYGHDCLQTCRYKTKEL